MGIKITGNEPRDCFNPCGLCCKTLWTTVPELTENQIEISPAHRKGLINSKVPCPYQLEQEPWCRLKNSDRLPDACKIYLCDIAEAVSENKITYKQGLLLQIERKKKYEKR